MSDLRAGYVVRGEDPALLSQAAQQLLTELVDGRDAATVVEEHGAGGTDIDPGAVVDALATPPFITDRRVVVVREAGRLVAADATRLVACLADPVPGVVLVLVAGGGTIPAALVKAIDRLGGAVDSSVGTGKARSQWVTDQVRNGPVRLDARATAALAGHLGNDLGRLHGLLQTLASAYGEGAAVDEEKLAPFLGEAGAVAPWDLTDAIDAGEDVDALRALDRLLGAGGQHPLQILGSLHRHFEAMLRLDGAGVTTPEEAAARIGARSVYPAKKALEQGRRLGAGRIGRAITLLAEADLDVRGRSGLPDEAVLQVLVARLSRLAAGIARSGPGRTRRRASA